MLAGALSAPEKIGTGSSREKHLKRISINTSEERMG